MQKFKHHHSMFQFRNVKRVIYLFIFIENIKPGKEVKWWNND